MNGREQDLACDEASRSVHADHRRRRSKWVKVGLALTSLVVGFGSLELAARVYSWTARRERLLTYDSVTGWRPIPHARQFDDGRYPYLVRINSRGLRDDDHSYAKSESTRRIVVIGDSFVFGSGGVQHEQCFTEVLERRLNGVEVVNMGVPAFSTDQEYLLLQHEGFRYSPDVVVLVLFVNDFEQCFTSYSESIGKPKGYVTQTADDLVFLKPPPMRLWDRWSYASYVVGLLDRRLRVSSRYYERMRSDAPLNGTEKRQAYERLLTAFCALCRERKTRFVMMYIPFNGEDGDTVVRSSMLRVAADEGAPVLDMRDDPSFQGDAASSLYFEKDIHLNAKGHEVVASALAKALTASDF